MSIYEQHARAVKAEALAKVLIERGIAADELGLMDAKHWRMVALAAKVKPPSPETISEAVARYREILRLAEKVNA